jgi:membrane protease YdiL (CAAX protease family)
MTDPGLEADTPSELVLPVSLAAAYVAFAITFRGPKERFWARMTRTGAVLGAMALATDTSLRRTRIRASDIASGLVAAAGLYGIFQVGDRAARKLMPKGNEEIDVVYGLRQLRPAVELAVRLAAVIGPAEELFWRGLVQRLVAKLHGRWQGAALTAGAYAGAHAVTGNLTLVGAAGVAGAYWSALAAAGLPMGALIVCHVAWDIWIFLLAPTGPTSSAPVS